MSNISKYLGNGVMEEWNDGTMPACRQTGKKKMRFNTIIPLFHHSINPSIQFD